MLFFLSYILIYHSGKEIPCDHATEARSSRLCLLVPWPDF